MSQDALYNQKIALEGALGGGDLDFAAAYLALRSLHDLIADNPWAACSATIRALTQVLKNPRYASQTQSFFLYREAAETMVSVVVRRTDPPFIAHVLDALKDVLAVTGDSAHRASTEALGSLPLRVRGPNVDDEPVESVPSVSWQDISAKIDIRADIAPEAVGRTLVVPTGTEDKILAVKIACGEEGHRAIAKEVAWMEYLRCADYSIPLRFHVPIPVKIRGSYVFRLEDGPAAVSKGRNGSGTCAMGYIADKDYFTYPNDHRPRRQLDPDAFKEIICRNAWLFGRFASQGVVHAAPIPLFHNRVQRDRREDHGLYEWHRGGRLDRWLHSCTFPNFGPTGIRDFEHFTSFNGRGRQLYLHIGTQILSLLLATGSYFRNKDAARAGFDESGNPVDARDLFDRSLLQELIREIFLSYYHGFAEHTYCGTQPFHFESLADRMVDAMGVDRHMEEILRAADQDNMTDSAFRAFLQERGYLEAKAKAFKKGSQDIVVYTGPHLGGFNERISIPELIDAVGTMSALCVAGFWLRHRESA
jgi:hypothetical protein